MNYLGISVICAYYLIHSEANWINIKSNQIAIQRTYTELNCEALDNTQP